MDLYEIFKKEVLTKPGKNPEYLVGLKNNKLTITDFRYSKNKELIWICECECGNDAYVKNKKVFMKRIGCQSCTASLKSANRHHDVSHYGYKKRKYKEYKDGARKRHLDFLLTEKEFFKLIEDDCYYCGLEPQLKNSQYKVKTEKIPLKVNGVDRIDSSKGYTTDNTVSCCTDCNYGKHKKTKDEFFTWIKNVYEYNFKE